MVPVQALALRPLTGAGGVTLGAQTLSLSAATGSYSGNIAGTGGLTVAGGTQILSSANAYTGTTTVDSGAGLTIVGTGDVAASSDLANAGTLDIRQHGQWYQH